jgi:hypothetical protein
MTALALYIAASVLALGVFAGPSLARHLLLDARQRNTRRNQPSNLTDRGCAFRGGVKAVVTHCGSFNK